MEKDHALTYSIKTLEPGTDEFQVSMILAWRWLQDAGRARFFPHTGGGMRLHDFLDDARKRGRKNFAVCHSNELLSVIAIETDGDHAYNFHVLSPRGAKVEAITSAVYNIGWQLFDRLRAELVYTMVPSFRGHVHKGSKAMATACGMTPYGEPEQEELNGHKYSWQMHVLTRENWLKDHYGKKERRTDSKNAV